MYNPRELYHHGILGQKWGIRRYQNEDGTLTAAGKTRYRKLVTEANKLKPKTQTQRSIKSYSDDELREKINRTKLETSAMDAEYQWRVSYNRLNPAPVSAGKKFIETIAEASLSVVKGTIAEAGKTLILSKLNSPEQGSPEYYKQMADTLGYKRRILSETEQIRKLQSRKG